MAEVAFILGGAIALACGGLLLRGHHRSAKRLLLWSGICFLLLGLENFLLFLDLVVMPDVDLKLVRGGVSLGALAFLLYGLVWEKE